LTQKQRPSPKPPKASSAPEPETPDDAEPSPKEPLRQCLVTRERLPKEVMIRFVQGPEGDVVPDLAAKLPGRGAWVVADRAAIEAAAKKGLFARAFGGPVRVPEGFADRIEALLVRRLLDLLGQARKAGVLVLGSTSVQTAARAGEIAALIEASDGAPDGRRKAESALVCGGRYDRARPMEGALIAACFTCSELSLALGRENVIHAALPEGGFAVRFLADARRLQGFRALSPEPG